MVNKRVGDRGGEDGGRGKRGPDVLQLLGQVVNKVFSCEGGRKAGRGRREKNMKNCFLRMEVEGLILVR